MKVQVWLMVDGEETTGRFVEIDEATPAVIHWRHHERNGRRTTKIDVTLEPEGWHGRAAKAGGAPASSMT